MNPKLEQQPDIEVLWDITRERQAEMRREAQTAHALGGSARSAKAVWPIRLAVALCVVVPIVLLLTRVAAAASGGGGGSGFIHLAM